MLNSKYHSLYLVRSTVFKVCLNTSQVLHSWSWEPDVFIILYVFLSTVYYPTRWYQHTLRWGHFPKLKMILMCCVSWVLIYFFYFQLEICSLVRMDRKCKNNLDRFCYICGNAGFPNRQTKITEFVKKTYCDYFGVKLSDHDKPFPPYICCKTCVESIINWRNGKRKSKPLAIPMV